MKNKELVELLKELNYTITTCESCTGGLIASAIVDISGSSQVLDEAYITYAASSKVSLVGVDETIINKYGVVSEEVAYDMALKSRIKACSNVSISSTGVAGPSGGTSETPVGTVCFGFNINGNIETITKHFQGDRNIVRNTAREFAIDHMFELLKNKLN